MRIGIFGDGAAERGGLDGLAAAIAEAEDQGFASFWMEQIFGYDTLTALAVAGRSTTRIGLGTAVVPTYPRHPMMLAAQALTVQGAVGGRLTLGVGLSHQVVIEGLLGLSFEHPLRHMRDYLSVLVPLIRDGNVAYAGETISTHVGLTIPDSLPCPVLVAALGTRMLELAGRVADGTITWMTGPATLAAHTVPTITRAAAAVGAPAPRVAVGLPVCVTDDVAGARERAARLYAVYGTLPSYRAMLDREGVDGPADLAIAGDEAAVTAGIERVFEAGATELFASEFGDATERARTRELLRSLL